MMVKTGPGPQGPDKVDMLMSWSGRGVGVSVRGSSRPLSTSSSVGRVCWIVSSHSPSGVIVLAGLGSGVLLWREGETSLAGDWSVSAWRARPK